MIKNLLISLFISTLVVSSSYAAGSSDSGSSKTKTKYDMAVTHIKAAKNFDFTVTDKFSGGNLANTTMKVVCDTYNINYVRDNFHSLTCTLRRVYEP